MAVKNFDQLPAGAQSAINRIKAGNANVKTGEAALEAFKDMPNRNVEASVWRENDESVIPPIEDLSARCVEVPVGEEAKAACVILPTNRGEKQFFLSSLKKSVVEYDSELVPTGRIIESDTQLHDEALACGTQYELFHLLASKAGKKLKVTKVEKCKTARFKDRVPVSLTNGTVAFFDIVE